MSGSTIDGLIVNMERALVVANVFGIAICEKTSSFQAYIAEHPDKDLLYAGLIFGFNALLIGHMYSLSKKDYKIVNATKSSSSLLKISDF